MLGFLPRQIRVLSDRFSVCQIASMADVPDEEYVFLARTPDEISLVCRSESVPESTPVRDDGWRGMLIQGCLDFSLVGILNRILEILALQSISVFAVSTYNTDYIFVKGTSLDLAVQALKEEAYDVVFEDFFPHRGY